MQTREPNIGSYGPPVVSDEAEGVLLRAATGAGKSLYASRIPASMKAGRKPFPYRVIERSRSYRRLARITRKNLIYMFRHGRRQYPYHM